MQSSHSPIRIVQISDTHLSRRRPFFQHNWEILIELMNAEAPDLIVCTGDMTFDGADHQDELAFASRQFERIASQILFVPGNHDIGNSLPDVRGGEIPITEERRHAYRQYFCNDCWFRDVGSSWRLIGLNSMLFGSRIAGEEQQWDMLEEAIGTAHDRSLMIFQHKPLYHRMPTESAPTQSAIYPEHRARLKRMLARARQLVVCSGHIHHYRTASWGKIAQIWAPATSFTIGIPGQKALRGTRRVGYVRHTFSGKDHRHEFVEPCQFVNMDFGNWGRDPRGFHARYGTEELRGLVLAEHIPTDAFERTLGELDLAGSHPVDRVRTMRGSGS
jgi:predicted MPP superfamily phosphohydrolase